MPAGRTSIICSKCQYQYSVEDKFLNKLLSCPKCNGKFYAQPAHKDIQESIKTSASTTGKIKTGAAPVDHVLNARRRKMLTVLISIPLILLLLYGLYEIYRFSSRSTGDIPDQKTAFSTAVDLLKSQSGLANIEDALFSKKFSLDRTDPKQKTYRLRTSVTMTMPDQKKPSENKISIDLKYLGDDKWEYVGYSFDK